jgi:tetratricopeptide (TPR) repeat protein
MHYYKSELVEALECTEKVVEIIPDDYNSWNNIGYIHLKLKNYEKSKEILMKTLEINDEYPLTWSSLGELYEELGDEAEAIKHYEKALILDPNQKDAKEGLERLKKIKNN